MNGKRYSVGNMRTKRDMRFYLRIYRDQQKLKIAGLVLSKGVWFLGKSNADEMDVTSAWKRERAPASGECFQNAKRFCLDCADARYFEGFVLIAGMPMHHAWNVLDGKVVDFTYEAADQKTFLERGYRESLDPIYFGVEVPRISLTDSPEPTAEPYLTRRK